MKVALVITLYNEENSINDLLKSINKQTREPDEIIFVDSCSTDRTSTILQTYKDTYSGKARVVVIEKKTNRAEGRNIGILRSKANVIAITDGGCILKKNWLELITKPFKSKDVDVVSGFYLPTSLNEFGSSLSTYTCVPKEKMNEDFLPSSRSIAFRKEVWKSVGGYPAYLQTCEDLIFARNLKVAGARFYLEKKAIVYWKQKNNLIAAFRQFFNYAVGDGEAMYVRFQTPLLFARYLVGALLFIKYITSRNEIVLYILLCLFLLYCAWSIYKNFKYVKLRSSLLYLPLLQFTSDIAILIGMPIGLIRSFKLRDKSNRKKNTLAALYGFSWMALLQIFVRLFSFLKYAIVLRLITPLDFGIYSLAIIVLGTVEVFSEFGIQQFLIQHKNGYKYIDTAFIISIFRGLILFLLLLMLAIPLAYFFNQKQLAPSIVLISLIPLIKGFTNPLIYTFQKRLEFHKDVLLKFIGILSDSFISIILVIMFPTVTVLFISLIASALMETTASYILVRKFPRINFRQLHALEIIRFSKWLLSAGGIHYIATQIDSVILSKLLGVTALGAYQATQRFSLKMMTETGDIPSKISFPIFSNIKNNQTRFRQGFIKTFVTVSIVWGFLAFMLILFTEEVIGIFLGNKWIAESLLFRIFVLTGYLQVLMGIITSAYLSYGKQEFTAKVVLLRLIAISLTVFPFINLLGQIGASLSVLIGTILSFPFALRYLRRIL